MWLGRPAVWPRKTSPITPCPRSGKFVVLTVSDLFEDYPSPEDFAPLIQIVLADTELGAASALPLSDIDARRDHGRRADLLGAQAARMHRGSSGLWWDFYPQSGGNKTCMNTNTFDLEGTDIQQADQKGTSVKPGATRRRKMLRRQRVGF